MKLSLFKDSYVSVSLALSAALFLVTFGIAYFNLKNVDHLLVIHFVGGRGIDFLGDKYDVWSILFSALVIILVNLFLVKIFYNRIRFFSYLLSFFNIFFSILILIAVGVIIAIN